MEIIVPRTSKHLRITHQMWEDLLCDPVMAAWVICGYRLDAFQAARLRYYWWTQNVIDSSGITSGKTVVLFVYLCCRAILIPNQEIAIYYPTFGQGKMTFWDYFTRMALKVRDRAGRIFRAQLGNPLKTEMGEELDGDGTFHGPDAYKAYFLNGSKILMPAPSFARDSITQTSLRFNVLVIEEWPHVDASSDGINKVLIDRTTRESWNQFHPIWGNHILYSAHAETLSHPAAARYQAHQRRVRAGDPTYVNIRYSYKDYSDRICHSGKTFKEQYRIESTIRNKRNTCSDVEWDGQGFGIWGVSGKGWFSEEALMKCRQAGKERGVMPALSRIEYEQILNGRNGQSQQN